MIVAETWLGAALNRVWCAPKKGKRGNDFYLLCLTTESFTYFVGASQHASSGFRYAREMQSTNAAKMTSLEEKNWRSERFVGKK